MASPIPSVGSRQEHDVVKMLESRGYGKANIPGIVMIKQEGLSHNDKTINTIIGISLAVIAVACAYEFFYNVSPIPSFGENLLPIKRQISTEFLCRLETTSQNQYEPEKISPHFFKTTEEFASYYFSELTDGFRLLDMTDFFVKTLTTNPLSQCKNTIPLQDWSFQSYSPNNLLHYGMEALRELKDGVCSVSCDPNNF